MSDYAGTLTHKFISFNSNPRDHDLEAGWKSAKGVRVTRTVPGQRLTFFRNSLYCQSRCVNKEPWKQSIPSSGVENLIDL